jgi:hypothetical protein
MTWRVRSWTQSDTTDSAGNSARTERLNADIAAVTGRPGTSSRSNAGTRHLLYAVAQRPGWLACQRERSNTISVGALVQRAPAATARGESIGTAGATPPRPRCRRRSGSLGASSLGRAGGGIWRRRPPLQRAVVDLAGSDPVRRRHARSGRLGPTSLGTQSPRRSVAAHTLHLCRRGYEQGGCSTPCVSGSLRSSTDGGDRCALCGVVGWLTPFVLKDD